jgi:hypothetical protein
MESRALPHPGVPAAIALALATFFISWGVLGHHRSSPVSPGTTSTTARNSTVGPLLFTDGRLQREVVELGQPVYWLGTERGHRFELKRASNGSVFLRYLPAGVPAGNPAAYRTVGTYPFAGAFGATHRLAGEAQTVWFSVRGGGIAVYRRSRPTNVYLAWPGFDYQVEVFDPSAAAAHRLAASTRLRRV